MSVNRMWTILENSKTAPLLARLQTMATAHTQLSTKYWFAHQSWEKSFLFKGKGITSPAHCTHHGLVGLHIKDLSCWELSYSADWLVSVAEHQPFCVDTLYFSFVVSESMLELTLPCQSMLLFLALDLNSQLHIESLKSRVNLSAYFQKIFGAEKEFL